MNASRSIDDPTSSVAVHTGLRRRRGPGLRRPLAGLAVLSLVLLGCADDDPGGDASGADGDGPVELVTYDAYVLDDDAAATFADEQDREISVLQQGDAGSMTARAVLSAGKPEGDVLFGVDNTLLTRALDAELFEPLPDDVLDLVPEQYRVDGPGGDTVVAIDSGQVCVNADTAWFEKNKLI